MNFFNKSLIDWICNYINEEVFKNNKASEESEALLLTAKLNSLSKGIKTKKSSRFL